LKRDVAKKWGIKNGTRNLMEKREELVEKHKLVGGMEKIGSETRSGMAKNSGN
jgi:hypothetical protein